MKSKLVLLLLFCLVSVGTMGQNVCFNPTIEAAKAEYNKGNYKRAKEIFIEAKSCYDMPKKGGTAQIDGWIKKCNEKLNSKSDNNTTFTPKVPTIEMVYVEGGTFTMGATPEQGGDIEGDEKPTHSVTLSSFYIGKYEVTQVQWKAVMGSNPSYCKGDNLPVENMSWKDVQVFIRKLNAMTGQNYRLPTEAEWEYAARGGSESRGYKYSGSDDIDAVAWYGHNSGTGSYRSHPVGRKQANELGLFDMSGNVYEWCQDWYGGYSSTTQTNPTGPDSGLYRVYRGDSWIDGLRNCRVSSRGYNEPNRGSRYLGFRLALSE